LKKLLDELRHIATDTLRDAWKRRQQACVAARMKARQAGSSCWRGCTNLHIGWFGLVWFGFDLVWFGLQLV
jgi:hypothetical protein